MAHGAFDNELDALAGMRELLSFLPLSNREQAPRVGGQLLLRKCRGWKHAAREGLGSTLGLQHLHILLLTACMRPKPHC